MHKSNPRRQSHRGKIPFSFILGGICLLLILTIAGCNLPLLKNSSPGTDISANSALSGMSLEQALAVTPRDDRPAILDQMGPPDAFRITFETLNSQIVRQEEWSYFDDQTELDFVDGTLVSTQKIESVPDGTIFASVYDPLAFTAGMSLEETQSIMPGQTLAMVDLKDNGVPDGVAAFGEQILLGFDQGRLVYVETLVMVPEVTQ